MDMEIVEESITVAPELARIPISFEVESVFDVSAPCGGLGGLILSERRLDAPYVKDYDTAEGEHPAQWAARFDVSNWGLIGAHSNGARVGGAVVAFNTQGVNMLEGRRDLAVLWDIRVSPGSRAQGVGFALFRAVEAWAAARGCRQLKIET
jgi:GNAT superfamily N-acetyltransferase